MRISVCIRHADVHDFYSSVCALPFGESEKERLLSIKNASASRSSLCALEALSTLLADEHIDRIPTISRESGKKPRFSSDIPYSFNLSHSGELAAAALCFCGEVGIDIEFVRKDTNHMRIARRFFGQKELSALEGAGGDADSFCRLWTKKEATSKLFGTGLGESLGKDISAPFYKTFVITSDSSVAYMTVCAESVPDEIRLIYPTKEYKIYELQN